MDVGAPSNFSRMHTLFRGSHEALSKVVWGEGFSDKQTVETIERVYQEYGYLLDPHGAVGLLGAEKYRQGDPSAFLSVVLATAHPAKFLDTVEEAIGREVSLPPALEKILDLPKQAETISTNFEDLKRYLLNKVPL
mgnify:CR=1 FL=1